MKYSADIKQCFEHDGESFMIIKVDDVPERLKKRQSIIIEVEDIEKITTKQRSLIFALCKVIAKQSEGTEQTFDCVRREMLKYFSEAYDLKSLSMRSNEMSKEVARQFITYLLAFTIYNDIDLTEELHKNFLDHEGYVYQLVLKRKCICCGKQGAHIHHVGGYIDEFDATHSSSRVGMGNNRRTITHTNKEVLPLCYEHHQEAHQKGDGYLLKKYHLLPLLVDDKLNSMLRK